MPEKTEHPYLSIDMTKVGQAIGTLHEQVVHDRKRVEITRAGSNEVCVMISKSELESLEQALTILADTEGFTDMCDNLRKLLNRAGMVYAPPEQEPIESSAIDAETRSIRFDA